MKLTGRVALVTGGAVRVGREIALALAARGMHLIIHYHNSSAEAAEIRDQLIAMNIECRLVRGELHSETEIRAFADQALQYWGSVDLLVNNAAVYYKKAFSTLTIEDWDDVMSVNLRAPFLLSQILGLGMKTRGEGAIINIADWSAERPYADYLPYCVSKAGIIALTKALAKALAPAVAVNAVSPGAVMMPDDFPEEALKSVIDHTLVKRLGNARDIAAAVAFLAESDFITGSNLIVDGGRLIYGT